MDHRVVQIRQGCGVPERAERRVGKIGRHEEVADRSRVARMLSDEHGALQPSD